MRHHLTLLVILLSMLFASCDWGNSEAAERLDRQIANINDSMSYYGKTWGDELKIAVNSLDFSNLQPVRLKMQQFIEKKTAEVDKIEPVGKSGKLLKAEMDFLKFEHAVVKEKFAAFEKYDDTVYENYSETELTQQLGATYSDLLKALEQEYHHMEKIQSLREEYAVESGFPKPIDELDISN